MPQYKCGFCYHFNHGATLNACSSSERASLDLNLDMKDDDVSACEFFQSANAFFRKALDDPTTTSSPTCSDCTHFAFSQIPESNSSNGSCAAGPNPTAHSSNPRCPYFSHSNRDLAQLNERLNRIAEKIAEHLNTQLHHNQ